MNACLSFPSPNLPSLIFPKHTLLFYIPMPLLNLLVCLKNAWPGPIFCPAKPSHASKSNSSLKRSPAYAGSCFIFCLLLPHLISLLFGTEHIVLYPLVSIYVSITGLCSFSCLDWLIFLLYHQCVVLCLERNMPSLKGDWLNEWINKQMHN